jgi:hypothetical protein
MRVFDDVHLRLVRCDEASHLSAHDARHRVSEEVLAAENVVGGHVKPGGIFYGLHLLTG